MIPHHFLHSILENDTALNRSVTQSERTHALQLALTTFTHDNADLHNLELQNGADKALCLKLGYIVVTSPESYAEISLVCQCLIKLYGGSVEQRKRSFRSIGATELVPLLTKTLLRLLTRGRRELESEEVKVGRNIVQVLRVYSKLDAAKALLIRYDKGAWLGSIVRFCGESVQLSPTDPSTITFDLLGLVKDLTFRSARMEKQLLLTVNNRLLLQFLFHFCGSDGAFHLKLVEWFTAVVWNLVLDKHICCELIQGDHTRNFRLVKKLLLLCKSTHDNNGENASQVGVRIRRNAVSSIGNVAAHGENLKLLLTHSGNGELWDQLNLVPILMEIVANDTDSVVRRRGMRTIRCIVSTSDAKLTSSFSSTGMSNFLAGIVSQHITLDDENDRDTQIQACQVVTATMTEIDLGAWLDLEKALLARIESTTDEKLIQTVCTTLANALGKGISKQGPSKYSDMVWTRLHAAASTRPASHEAIASLLLQLTKVERDEQTRNNSSLASALTSTAVINTLATIVSSTTEKQHDGRWKALDTVVLLAENEANKHPLADNEHLLGGLVDLCLTQPEGECKAKAKKVIIDLVPSL